MPHHGDQSVSGDGLVTAGRSGQTGAMTADRNRHDDERERQEEARRSLARVHRDSAPVLDSALRRSGDFFTARGESQDPAEIWGKRVGRGLAVLAGIGCLVYLVLTYLR